MANKRKLEEDLYEVMKMNKRFRALNISTDGDIRQELERRRQMVTSTKEIKDIEEEILNRIKHNDDDDEEYDEKKGAELFQNKFASLFKLNNSYEMMKRNERRRAFNIYEYIQPESAETTSFQCEQANETSSTTNNARSDLPLQPMANSRNNENLSTDGDIRQELERRRQMVTSTKEIKDIEEEILNQIEHNDDDDEAYDKKKGAELLQKAIASVVESKNSYEMMKRNERRRAFNIYEYIQSKSPEKKGFQRKQADETSSTNNTRSDLFLQSMTNGRNKENISTDGDIRQDLKRPRQTAPSRKQRKNNEQDILNQIEHNDDDDEEYDEKNGAELLQKMIASVVKPKSKQKEAFMQNMNFEPEIVTSTKDKKSGSQHLDASMNGKSNRFEVEDDQEKGRR